MMKPNNFATYLKAQESFIGGKLQAAILSEQTLQKRWKHGLDCDLNIVQNILKQPIAFPLPKKSPWREPISHLIRKYQENGFLDDIKSKYMAAKCFKEKAHQPQQFSLLYLSGACIMLVLGILLSIALFNGEHLFSVCSRRWRGNATLQTHCQMTMQ